MGLFNFWRSKSVVETRAIDEKKYPWLVACPPAAGIRVTIESALSNPTIYRAVDTISSTIASLPLPVFNSNNSDKAYDHPVYKLLNTSPNPTQTAYQFRKQLAVDGLCHNESMAVVERENGLPKYLWRVDPTTVKVEPGTKDGLPALKYSFLDGSFSERWQDDILHTVYFSLDGLRGESPFAICSDSVSLTLALDRFAAKFMKNGAKPSGKLDPPEGAQPADVKEAREAMAAYEGADNAGKTFIPPTPGWTWTALSSNPNEFQMHESRIHQMRDCQRITGIQPPLTFDLERQTWANLQYQRQDFVQNTIRPNVIPLEQEVNRKLFTPAEQENLHVEHVLEGLLRGSFQEQVATLTVAVGGPFMTSNEARRLFPNLPDLDGGDELVNTKPEPVEPEPMTDPEPEPTSQQEPQPEEQTEAA